jgi:hypothetical protein
MAVVVVVEMAVARPVDLVEAEVMVLATVVQQTKDLMVEELDMEILDLDTCRPTRQVVEVELAQVDQPLPPTIVVV